MTKAEQPTITQADRDAAAEVTVPNIRAINVRLGHLDDTPLVQAFARHRTTSLAAQDGLVEALERCAQIVEQWNHRQNEKVDDIKYIVRNALSAIKGDKS